MIRETINFNSKNFNLTTQHNLLASEHFQTQNKENKTNKRSHDSISQNLQAKLERKCNACKQSSSPSRHHSAACCLQFPSSFVITTQ
uniref:Uncharacterized protein n=1 Tax=Populus trichocarpa TaxID=3694 RepID=A0A2K1XNX3_POPTR